jgi:hypothetical protein
VVAAHWPFEALSLRRVIIKMVDVSQLKIRGGKQANNNNMTIPLGEVHFHHKYERRGKKI